MVILVRNPNNPAGLRHYVTGADGTGVTFSEDASMALVFADAAAATAFAVGKNVQGAQQVVVSGITNKNAKTCT